MSHLPTTNIVRAKIANVEIHNEIYIYIYFESPGLILMKFCTQYFWNINILHLHSGWESNPQPLYHKAGYCTLRCGLVNVHKYRKMF